MRKRADEIRVVILAPTLALRAGLHALLGSRETADGSGDFSSEPSAGPVIRVIAQAGKLGELGELPPDTDVLLMAGGDEPAISLRQALAPLEGQAAVLLISEEKEVLGSLALLPVRAWGLLLPEAGAEEIQVALHALFHGICVGPPRFVVPSVSAVPEADPLLEPLTERENQVLQLIAKGLANKQIASLLGISEHTVKFHLSSVYGKLGATNRAEAVRLGMQQGLVPL